MSKLKYIFIGIFCLFLFNAKANNWSHREKDPTHEIKIKSHSLFASEGTKYQWYLNNIKINDATSQELEITSPGIYKLEMTNFDGDVIEKQIIVGLTNSGAIIRVFTIGDSTVQDYASGYYPRKGWGQVLPIFFNAASVTVLNRAVGGTSSKSFYNSFWPAVRDELQAGDFVFIQFGINDRNNADPARYTPIGGEFEGYLTKYVNETKAKGAFPVLVATLRRNAWNTDGTVYDAYHDHPVATRTTAKNLGVPLIDLDAKAKVLLESVGETYATRLLYNNYEIGEYPNYKNGNADNVHFQEMGAIEMAKLVAQGIRDLSADPNVKKLIPFLKPEYQIAVAVNPVGADIVTTHTTSYPQGLTITLKTIPKTANTFQNWNNAAGGQLSTAVLTTVTSGTSATSYTAMYKGATACVASITTTTPTTFCAGGSIELTANPGSSYKWFSGTTQVGTASTYKATTAGSYTVEVINSAGCKATSLAKALTVNPLPLITQYAKIDAGTWLTTATASVCEASTVNLGPQPNIAAGWSWTGPNNFTSTLRNPVLTTITTANAGTYTSTYTDANGCKATSSFVLQVPKPTAAITSASGTLIPYTGSILLNASTGTGYTYQWKKDDIAISGATASSYTANSAGSYTVTISAMCSLTSPAIILTAAAAPKKYIYTYDNSGNIAWTNTNSWTPKAVPTAIDTVIIRTGEVQINALTHAAPVYVETNGILRLVTANSTVNKINMQGGTLKVFTSSPELALTSDITVEQPSTIMAGSVPATVFTLNGTITGNATLTKTSVGILRINSTATSFKGNWIVTEGKLQVRSATGLGVCGVQILNEARLDIEVAGASIYSLMLANTAGVDLDQNLNVNVAVFGTENILSGAFKNANYPT